MRHPHQGLVLATVLTVALHGLGALALSPSGWGGGGEPSASAGASQLDRGLRVRLAARADLPEQAGSLEPVELADPAESPVASPTEPTDSLARLSAGGALAARYLSDADVDQGPAPESGWALDEAVLPPATPVRLVLRLWVSEQGRIDRVQLVQAEPAGDWAGRAAQALASTPMRPALRDGQAVAASAVVEITAEAEAEVLR